MQKRTIYLGDYDTAAHKWTLTGWSFPEPEPETYMVSVPGRIKGPLDLSTALTDGEPVYGPRPLNVTLETSEDDRLTREDRISGMVNALHGRRIEPIVLPDDPGHFIVGRLTVKRLYNDLAHGSVEVSGTCEPWRYAVDETVVELTATTTEQTATLWNSGTMPVLPVLMVTAGSGETLQLTYNGARLSLSVGTYEWPELLLTSGSHDITYSGAGTLKITYREAVL